jgi:ATP-binding cassette subfamily B protein
MTAPAFSLPAEVTWPLSSLHEAIPLLAEKASLLPGATHNHTKPNISALPDDGQSMENFSSWLENTGEQLGLEIVEVETAYQDQEKLLLQAAPALLLLPQTDEGDEEERQPAGFVLLVARKAKKLCLLGQKGGLHSLPVHQLRDILVRELEAPLEPMIHTIVEQVNIQEHKRDKVQRALLREYLSVARVGGCWMLRLPPGASFIRQLFRARFPGKLVGLLSATLIERLLILLASFLIGTTILQGSVDLSDFQLWALLLLAVIPVHVLALQLKNRLSLDFGMLLRSRLLYGILQLRPEEIQHQGSGYFVGTVQEIEQLEAMGMSSAFMTATSFIEVLLAVIVLMLGAGGLLHGMLLVLWTGAILLLGWIYYLRMRDWLIHSRVMTCDLVERMVGHRTRLAQEQPEQFHELEDQLLSRYTVLSERLDSMEVIMKSAAGRRGWLPVSLLATLTLFVSTGVGVSMLAVSLGGTLLAALALDQLGQSIYQFLKTMMSWEQVYPLYQAAGREHRKKTASFVSPTCFEKEEKKHPIIQAEKLCFSYPDAGHPEYASGQAARIILDQCNLTIHAGQYVLLEGASGSGKSTLAAVLSGLQQPDTGSLHVLGFSLESLGKRVWRKRVVLAPQFHKNYVVTETLAFNLLMGRGWPPSQDDLEKAETICHELGLGELLKAMPSGLQQMVGEGGWRLSHGERSRLFIARTLLQQADLIILDESFAALDPETLHIALSCVLRRARALLLIAHP